MTEFASNWQREAPAASGIREEVAQLVYESWYAHPDYVPWMPKGNSFKQDDARRVADRILAIPAIAAALASDVELKAVLRSLLHHFGPAGVNKVLDDLPAARETNAALAPAEPAQPPSHPYPGPYGLDQHGVPRTEPAPMAEEVRDALLLAERRYTECREQVHAWKDRSRDLEAAYTRLAEAGGRCGCGARLDSDWFRKDCGCPNSRAIAPAEAARLMHVLREARAPAEPARTVQPVDDTPELVVPLANVLAAAGIVADYSGMPTLVLTRDDNGTVQLYGTHNRQHCLDLVADATEWFLIGGDHGEK